VCAVDKAFGHGGSTLGVGPGVFGRVYAFKHLGLASHGYIGVGELDHQVVEVGASLNPRRSTTTRPPAPCRLAERDENPLAFVLGNGVGGAEEARLVDHVHPPHKAKLNIIEYKWIIFKPGLIVTGWMTSRDVYYQL